MNRAKTGDRVRVEISRLPTNAAFVQWRRGEPIEFTIGGGEMIPGVSRGVIGMAQGETRHLTIQPEDAYGVAQRELIQEVSRRRFPRALKLRVGKRLTAVGRKSGHRLPLRILAVKPRTVLVDGNHPLAGKVLVLDVVLLSLASPCGAAARPDGHDATAASGAADDIDIGEDHRRFRELQHELRNVFSSTRPHGTSRFAIINMLADFRDQLGTEFAWKERFAYFEDLFESLPRLRDEAGVLHLQHCELFVKACRMADEAVELLSCQGTLPAFRRIARSYQNFDALFLIHEARENELVTRAYYDDVGVCD
jgi:FKBP-type peptidyl-prolyl cis-trans isomerase 2